MDIQKYKKFLLDFTDCDNYNLYDWFITKQIFSEDDLNIIYNSYLLKSYKIKYRIVKKCFIFVFYMIYFTL